MPDFADIVTVAIGNKVSTVHAVATVRGAEEVRLLSSFITAFTRVGS
jgi:hypothetical protein